MLETATAARGTGYLAAASFGQQRLWMLDRLLQNKAAYNETVVDRLTGPLDVRAFERALNEVVRRHDVLRTRYAVIDGGLQQIVAPASEPALPVEDLGILPPAEREPQARRRAQTEFALPFDLARGPLMRAKLLRLAAQEYWLVLTVHHSVFDRWSASVFARELGALYTAFSRGQASPLPDLPMRYADYAEWQRESLAGDKLERLCAHWTAALAGVESLDLPLDRLRPAVASQRGGQVDFEVGEALTQALRDLGRREGATLFMTLLAAFQVLLWRWSGQDDIVVGVPVAGRGRHELESLIGFFVNMLVIRNDLSGDPSFAAHLRRVREVAVDAYAHAELPFEKLVERLAPSRDLARNPIYQVSFRMGNTPPLGLRLPGVAIERVHGLGTVSAKFDLSIGANETAGGLSFKAEYATDLFDRDTIECMTEQFTALLRNIATDPQRAVSRLPLYDQHERARLIAQGRRPATGYPSDASIEELFEAQARARPDSVAVVDAGNPLTYGEIDARADRLARILGDCDLGARRYVGICLERGSDLAAGMLAILKARAAYVPLDPDLPPERLAHIVADAGISLVVTVDRFAPRLPPGIGRIICVDQPGDDAPAPANNPLRGNAPDDVAYVMYTSGSTGVPKGVAVTHRAVIRLVCDTDYVTLGRDDVIAQLANPAFDAATFEIWGALLNGARLVTIPREIVLTPREFAATLQRERVTTAFLTTALFNHVAREMPSAFRGCRNVLFGGEAAEPHWVEAILRAGAPDRLLHMYGPTETTTFATWHEVHAIAPGAPTIPIGRPIANCEVYILDTHREPVPLGVPGEVFIGGPGVARGYVGNPQLSQERFVPNPFATEPGERLYKTGDRARFLANGGIEFLGRFDRQVKIRGHRVELEEVEAVIERLPDVKAAVVELRGDTTETRQLIAYVVDAERDRPPPTDLWNRLRPLLPEYMLPATILWLRSLPLNSNGKIDRSALPAVRGAGAPPIGVPVAPRDMFEHLLARIWGRLLDRESVGVFDHFFELGGHSLMAAQLCAEIERETGLDVPLTALFADDTIAGLARALRDRPSGADATILAVNEDGTLPPLAFLHGDLNGGGFYSRSLAQALGSDQPVLVVQPHGVGNSAIPETIEAMAADRIRDLRTIAPHGPYVVGGYCNGAFVAFEMARQLRAQGAQVPAVVVIEARPPRDGDASAATDAGQMYFTIDERGGLRPLAARDRYSDAQLRYLRAMDNYRGGACSSHLVLVRSRTSAGAVRDLGWTRFFPSSEIHVLPGNHETLVTRHVFELAATIRSSLARVMERAAAGPAVESQSTN